MQFINCGHVILSSPVMYCFPEYLESFYLINRKNIKINVNIIFTCLFILYFHMNIMSKDD